jgi:two-component system cell cycle response regulator
MSAARVLVVSATDEVRDAVRRDLAAIGHTVAGATDVEAALAAAEHERPAVVLADARHVAGLAEELDGTVIIAMAGAGEPRPAGAHDLLRVPHERDDLAARCAAAHTVHRLLAQVGRDDVTGLPGRERAQEELARTVAAARRHGRPVAVLLVDLDRFGEVARAHGRSASDAVLREVALRLSATLRAGDLAARLGGDLFMVVLSDAPAEQVALIGDRLRRSIEATAVRPGDAPLGVSASVGWAAWQGEEPETLLGRADEALLAAKGAGGNAVHPLG